MTYPVFTNGTVLPASDLNAIGLWLVKSQAVGNGVSSVVVSDAFSATFDNYLVEYSGGSASTGCVTYFALNGTSSGYYSGMSGATYAGAHTFAGTANASSVVYGGGGDNGWVSVLMTLIDPYKALFTKFSNPVWYATYAGHNAAVHAAATSHTGFTITPSSGTITGGTIYVYGYRK